jgi:hypothetical protein
MSSLLPLLAALTFAAPAGADDVDALLRRADAYRLPAGALEVETEVRSFRDGKLDKERRYRVYLRPGRRSLVLSRSPVEQGQKVLMLGDDFWIVLPSSQRPIRITPAQRLLGDASAGDVATLTWAGDYGGAVVGEAEVEGRTCVRLDLAARRTGATYQRIELYLDRADARPVRADLYLASDKLAKQARFELETVDGRLQVSAMTLADRIQSGRETVIRYLSRSGRSIADEFYNPMFLTRNEPAE